MRTIRDLIDRILGRGVAGAAQVSSKPVIHTDVYRANSEWAKPGWYFNWHDEKHESGELFGPYENREDAIFLRGAFTDKRERQGYLVIQENSR